VDELCLEEPTDLVGGEAVLAQFFDDAPDSGLRADQFGGACFAAAGRGDIRAGAMTEFEQALVLKFHVGLCNGVVADDELFGERADARHQVAILQDSGLDGVAHLLHQLEVERMS